MSEGGGRGIRLSKTDKKVDRSKVTGIRMARGANVTGRARIEINYNRSGNDERGRILHVIGIKGYKN